MTISTPLNKLTYEQFQGLPATSKIIFLHPNHHGQHKYILAWLLQETNRPIIYHHLTPQANLWEALTGAITQQTEQVLALNGNPGDDGQRLASWANLQIVLDGYDQVQDSRNHRYLHGLSQFLTEGQRIFILGRHLPVELLAEWQASTLDVLAMLPIATQHLLVDYTHPPIDKSLLEVHALGASQAYINGRLLKSWDGVLPKSLFYFLIDRAMTTRDDIFRTFWPDLPRRDATNVFHVTKRKVSEILGESLSAYGNGYYRVSDHLELYYDVVIFLEAVQQAESITDPDEARQLFKEALRLYRGPFLSNMSQSWIIERRKELEYAYVDTLLGLGKLHQGQPALHYLRRAHTYMPDRDDTTYYLMQHYSETGAYDAALTVYRRLENSESPTRETPSPQTLSLAQQIEVQRDA